QEISREGVVLQNLEERLVVRQFHVRRRASLEQLHLFGQREIRKVLPPEILEAFAKDLLGLSTCAGGNGEIDEVVRVGSGSGRRIRGRQDHVGQRTQRHHFGI